MDIWKWIGKLQGTLVEAGQAGSARLLDDLSSCISDLETERAESLLPEARALAKSLNNPWVEVFVGHWEMRNRLGARMEGESALPEMVALFERAHRPDTIDCPQSVCVTQDLGNCYANIDGPGWANERRAVIEETLQRIDPSWNCFICLSTEYSDALYDEGRHTEGLDWLDAQEAKLKATNGDYDQDSVGLSRAEHLMGLNRDEEALDLMAAQAARAEAAGPEWEAARQARQVRHALALAKLGRDEEAWEVLPGWHNTSPRNRIWWLASAALLLQRAPERNTWQLGSLIQDALDHLSRHGAHRPFVDSALIAARLALARKASWNARRLLAQARKHQARLRIDAGAGAKLDALETELANAPATELPVPAAQLMEWLGAREERDPEQEVQWLLAAQRERPEDQPLLLLTASALRACGAHEEAESLLWADIERRPEDEVDAVAQMLFESCLRRGEHEQVEGLIRHFETIEPSFSIWCQARVAAWKEDWARVIELCQAASESSENSAFIGLLAQGLSRQKRHAEAAAAYHRLAESEDEPRDALWHHMTCAAAAEDWVAVRDSAKRLEFTFSSDSGPFNEDMGKLIIRYHENNTERDYYAYRTGPVTARIVENAAPGAPQHVLDELVFDAGAGYLEDPPEEEEARAHFLYTYAAFHTLKRGGFGPSWMVEGVHPGEDRLKALIQALGAQGYEMWIHASEYELQDAENEGVTLHGVLMTAAAPQDRPAQELHELLQKETQDLPHRLCWLSLARHCGVDLSAHEACIARYGL
jgi:hypothetical protein